MNLFSKLIKYIYSGKVIIYLYCLLKGKYYTMKYVNGRGQIIFNYPYLKLRIDKCQNASFELRGNLILDSHCGGRGYVSIRLMPGASFVVENDFLLGQNCKIHVHNNAFLYIGGKKKESVSGITSDSIIMCYKNISIGTDLICGWNVFITDSDWHTTFVNGQKRSHHKDVNIGNHVWIGSNVIISKGVYINSNSVIAAFSKVGAGNFPQNSVLAGIPALVLPLSIDWNRDI